MNEAAAASILFYPFETGMLEMPGAQARMLVLGAGPELDPPAGLAGRLTLVQDFRPRFLALRAAGHDVLAQADGDGYDTVFVALGRHRAENEARLCEALRRVHARGIVVAAGARRDGAASLRKRVAERLPLAGHASRRHGTVFWFRPPAEGEAALADLSPRADTRRARDMETAAGGFSAGQIDPGSQLLVDCLPGDTAGAIADFGAGWGYLSIEAARRFGPDVRLDLYEAHLPSLEAARRNLGALAPDVRCAFFWRDLLREPVERRYDVVVMNPPFHQGRAAEPDIGKSMIAAAAEALAAGGRLFMVANRQLPYEPVLKTAFAAHGELHGADGFKVLWARV